MDMSENNYQLDSLRKEKEIQQLNITILLAIFACHLVCNLNREIFKIIKGSCIIYISVHKKLVQADIFFFAAQFNKQLGDPV